jgi:hypothetical protein
MSDFVTRLEAELRRAAIRQERAGGLLGQALPGLRVALPSVATAAIVAAGLAIALITVAVFVVSEPERAAKGDVPAELRGAWQLPPIEWNAEPVAAKLRLYPQGSTRCSRLGADSKPCYAIENVQFGALEWGTFSIAGDRITFRAELHVCNPCDSPGPELRKPGVYRWRVVDGSLHLTPQRDELTARSDALASGPLTQATEPAPTGRIPDGWTKNRFESKQYGYSIRYPGAWSAMPAANPLATDGLTLDASDTADRFSRDPRGVGVPLLLIAEHEVPPGTTGARWTERVNRHIEESGRCTSSGARSASVDGEAARITIYPECNRRHHQWATFVHAGHGYQVSWWGRPGRQQADAPLFHELLNSFEFTR